MPQVGEGSGLSKVSPPARNFLSRISCEIGTSCRFTIIALVSVPQFRARAFRHEQEAVLFDVDSWRGLTPKQFLHFCSNMNQ